MDQKQDIYREQESDKKTHEPAVVDRRYADMRARTWRNSLSFVALMLVVLGVAIWVIVEKDEEPPPSEGAPTEVTDDFLQPGDSDLAVMNAMVSPELTNLPPLEPLSADDAVRTMDPQKAARAMGEMRLADQYARAKEWDAAERHAFKALEIWPDMNEAMRMLGLIYTQRGQFDQAIVALERALKSNPFSAETLNTLATVYMQRGNMGKAEELLLSSIEIRPDYIDGHYNLGLLYIATGQYETSLDYLYPAAETLTSDPTIRNKLAVALLRLGRYDEARSNLQQLIDSLPEMSPAYFNMAITYALEQRHTEALNWIERGAQFCSPVMLQKFLSDTDFDGMRGHPEFQTMLRDLYPQVPGMSQP